jgi:hypothetical protein
MIPVQAAPGTPGTEHGLAVIGDDHLAPETRWVVYDVLDKAFEEVRISPAPFVPLRVDFDDNDVPGTYKTGAVSLFIKGRVQPVQQPGWAAVGTVGIFFNKYGSPAGGRGKSVPLKGAPLFRGR